MNEMDRKLCIQLGFKPSTRHQSKQKCRNNENLSLFWKKTDAMFYYSLPDLLIHRTLASCARIDKCNINFYLEY